MVLTVSTTRLRPVQVSPKLAVLATAVSAWVLMRAGTEPGLEMGSTFAYNRADM